MVLIRLREDAILGGIRHEQGIALTVTDVLAAQLVNEGKEVNVSGSEEERREFECRVVRAPRNTSRRYKPRTAEEARDAISQRGNRSDGGTA